MDAVSAPNALETNDLEVRFGKQVVLQGFSVSLKPC